MDGAWWVTVWLLQVPAVQALEGQQVPWGVDQGPLGHAGSGGGHVCRKLVSSRGSAGSGDGVEGGVVAGGCAGVGVRRVGKGKGFEVLG